jgi:RNA polymerase sigma factor (sigma-70 family)
MQTNETERQKFVELIEKHQGILHRICSIYANHTQDRQDLFQDMVLALWRSTSSFRGQSSLTTWMYRVALNTALLQKRKAARRPDLTRGGEAEIASVPVVATAPNDDAEMLRNCIRELPTLDRAIVLLHLEERSYEEIAEITGLTRSNVSVRLVRLKERLRRMIEEKGIGKEAFV